MSKLSAALRLASVLALLGLVSCTPSCQNRIYGIEVTQSVQSYPAQSVPLVAEKITVARLYVRPVSGGITSYRARLRVNRPGGPVVTVLPLAPYDIVKHTATPADFRYEADKSFMFALPSEMLSPGPLDLEAELLDQNNNPIAGTPPYKKSVSFINRLWFSYYGSRYVYSQAGPACMGMAAANVIPPLSEMYSQIPYMNALLPTANIYLISDGNPNVVPSFDNNDCGGVTRASAYAAKRIDYLHPHGGNRYYMLQPDKSPGYFGFSYVTGSSNVVTYAQNYLADEGPTLAHEMGHALGVWPHTFDPGSPYPRKDGFVGINPGIKTHFRPPQVVPSKVGGNKASFDIMSYTAPYWVSDFNYCQLLSLLSAALQSPTECGGVDVSASTWTPFDVLGLAYAQEPDQSRPAFGAAPTGIMASTEQVPAYLHITGTVGPGDTGSLLTLETLASDEDLASKTSGAAWVLLFRDANNQIVSRLPFDPPLSSARDAQTPISFAWFVRHDPKVRHIELRHGDRVVAERKASREAPRVELLKVPEGTVESPQRVEWRGKDGDGDALTYSLWYSADRGVHWLPVVVDHAATSFEVEFNRLPPSDGALLRVLATDGFHTTAARMTKPFRVTSPETIAWIGVVPSAPNQTTIHALGSAMSWKEGVISEPARFTWVVDGQARKEKGPELIVEGAAIGEHKVELRVQGAERREYAASTVVFVGREGG